MQEFLDATISGPTLPITIVLIAVCLYWLMVIVGAADTEFLDFDIETPEADVDIDAHAPMSIGFASLKFLNIGTVPLMVWLTALALPMWITSMLLDHAPTPESPGEVLGALARSLGIGLVAAKLLTQPLRGRFDPAEPNRARDLIGNHCTIDSSTVTPESGRARYVTGAAPLVLHVRTEDGTLTQGQTARIVDYDPHRHVYIVTAEQQED